jgi:lipoprotein-anchoring transpeptidase ErfK/SrfK
MITQLRAGHRASGRPAAILALTTILALTAIDAAGRSARARSDSLFEPWKATPSRNEFHRRRAPSDADDQPMVSPRAARDIGSEDAQLAPHLRRQEVEYPTSESVGTIIVDTANTYLYWVMGNGRAIRYGIGVGREGFTWSGRERISRMAEWPDWRPPAEMIERDPNLPHFMPGGLQNPLGARALYLGRTLYRIHGTNEPSTIGSFVSSGCIRMRNQDIVDLYQRVSIGAHVVVLGRSPSQSTQPR